MPTYYVRKTGNDAAAGTSAATAWLTIGKALTSATGGDTVYVGGGTYREVVSVSASPSSTLTLIGDVDGLHTGDFGEVVWTAFTTSDKTTSSASRTLNTNARDFLHFRNFTIIGGSSNSAVGNSSTTSNNITFEDCTFVGQSTSSSIVQVTAQDGVALVWLLDRCRFVGISSVTAGEGMLKINCLGDTSVDTNVIVRNCYFQGAGAAAISFVGVNATHYAGTGASGGSVIFNTAVGPDVFLYVSNWNPDAPVTANGNVIFTNTGFSASDAVADIAESYNINYAPITQTGLSGNGTGDRVAAEYAPLYNIGQELQQGLQVRPMMTPSLTSPSWAAGTTGSPPSVDLLNRTRPSGGGFQESTANRVPGALERHEIAVQETTVFDVSPNSIKITGPGDHRILVPVDAASTTITVRTRFTSGYAGSLPKAVINANGEIAVSTQTITATGSANTWSTLTFSAFTPTGKSWITLDLFSQDTSGTGIAYFDTITIS